MDAHYDSQIQSLATHHTTFSGPARQMGAGGGLGAFAVRMGRVAIPVVRKYILPVAKQVGKNLLEAALPQIGHVLSGKKRVSRKMLKQVAQNTAEQTFAKNAKMLKAPNQLDSRQAPRRAGRDGGGGSARSPANTSRKRLKATSSDKTTKTKNSIISGKRPAKRSRSDILSEIQFSSS